MISEVFHTQLWPLITVCCLPLYVYTGVNPPIPSGVLVQPNLAATFQLEQVLQSADGKMLLTILPVPQPQQVLYKTRVPDYMNMDTLHAC